MARELQFSKDYLRELEEAIDNWLLVSEGVAKRFGEKHDARTAELLLLPRMGTLEAPDRYSVPIGTSGYRIVYQVEGDTVRLVALINLRRAQR